MRVEADLILRARAGDRRALEALIRSYQTPVAGFVAVRVRDPAAIPDVCQTAFVKMALALHKLRSTETFEPWLYRIAENACRDHQRRERWRRRFFVPLGREHERVGAAEPGADGAPEARLDAELAELRLRLANTDPGQSKLLELSLERPRSYGELAELSQLSIPTVKSRLFRARAALRSLLARPPISRKKTGDPT
jgi:RNA polymerase sigma-70 factor (ECF subfamily)